MSADGVRTSVGRGALALALALAFVGAAGDADAAVKHEGTWPDADKAVSIDVTGATKQAAVKALADAAGWSVMMPAAQGASEPVDIHVKNQPAGKVLDLILADGEYVAKRDGTLIAITREATATEASAHADAQAPSAPPAVIPPIPPVPPMPPAASAKVHHGKHGEHDEDRVITNGHVTIDRDEEVGDVTVLSGTLDVFGDVNGDLAVFSGNVHVHDGGHVHGDAALVGGTLQLDDDSAVDGDIGVVGGSLKRSDKAHVGGKSRGDKGELKVDVDLSDDDDKERALDLKKGIHSHAAHIATEIGRAITLNAFLFIFGAILMALGTQRMETLKAEAAARPMRSFALGVVGSIAALVAFITLCVTLIGIPVALVGAVVFFVATYAGITAALTTAGQAVFGHKTKNPYVHLAVGCVMLLFLGSLPLVGGFVWAAVVFIGIGTLVATRGAGLVPSRTRTASDPYRTIADR